MAIGGVIFLLAFVAFRQASVNRRDTQRRSDVRRVLAEAVDFAGDNANQSPCFDSTNWDCSLSGTSWISFRDSYANVVKDPSSGNNYTFWAYNGSATFNLSNYFRVTYPVGPGNIVYGIRAVCYNKDLWTNNSYPQTAIGFWIATERGNGICVDNST